MNDDNGLPGTIPEVIKVPEGVPTLEFVQSQRGVLSEELDRPNFMLPDAGFKEVKQLVSAITAFVQQKSGVPVEQLLETESAALNSIFQSAEKFWREVPLFYTHSDWGKISEDKEKIRSLIYSFYVIKSFEEECQFWEKIIDEYKITRMPGDLSRLFWLQGLASDKINLEKIRTWRKIYFYRAVQHSSSRIAELKNKADRLSMLVNGSGKSGTGLMPPQDVASLYTYQKDIRGRDHLGKDISGLYDVSWASIRQENVLQTLNILLLQSELADFPILLSVGQKYGKNSKHNIATFLYWIEKYSHFLFVHGSAINTIFRYVFSIVGPIVTEKGHLTDEIQKSSYIPKDILACLDTCAKQFQRSIKAGQKRLKEIIPPADSSSLAVSALLSTAKADQSASEQKTEPVASKLTEIPAPAMNFTIDAKTGVLMRPQGWKIPDGCRLEGNFWYLDDSQKKPLTPSEGHFGQKSLYDVEFLNEGGQEFYGNVCFSATLTAPQGSTFSSGTSSISSPELSFTKLRRIEAPSMKFTIDENTGVVKVPDDWVLPDGCKVTWKACYKGNKGKELVQATGFQINNGILDISYQEGGKEVYGKLYVTVTLIAPQGSTFSSGTSISSPELSCFRKAPEVQTTKPDEPQNIVATSAGFGEVIVSFDPPVSNGGSPIMSYTVTASNGQKATGLKSPVTMKGLPGGKMYTFTVTATNHKGESNPSSASIPTVATLKCATFEDTKAAWYMALSDDSDGLWYDIDEEDNIIVTLDDKLVEDRGNLAIDNLVYRTITIDSKDMFDIGDVLGEEISASLRAYAGKIRQDILEKEAKRIEREKQNAIYHALQDELHPCMEVLRGLAGTELATEKLNGLTLSQAFREKGVPMTSTVVRKHEKPNYKNILTLNFTGRDVTVTYCDGKVIFSGNGYAGGSEGTQRAYHDFREVISELGAFLFLTEGQKSKRLKKLRDQRQALVGSFKNILTSPKKTVTAQLIAVSDTMLVPSCMGDSVAHVGFPPDGSPEVRYVVVTPETLEKEYEKLRKSIHGSGDASKNKSISIVCLVRTGHIHINGDTGGDKKPYNSETVAANIESLRNSPQGRMLLWDRIGGTYGGTGTKIINGALQALEDVKSLYDDTLPTDDETREDFIDDYLDELCDKGILISYVRFSAVTIKEVRAALEAGKSSATAD